MRTVSALLPYRPEFRAAGLAVTSHDQAKGGIRLKPRKQVLHKAPQWEHKGGTAKVHASQIDGKGDVRSAVSTEISFAGKDMDEWRYALIDEVPPPQSKGTSRNDKQHSKLLQCLPCRPDSLSGSSGLPGISAVSGPKGYRSPSKSTLPITNGEISTLFGNTTPTNRHLSKGRINLQPVASKRWFQRRRATGLRPRSLTLAQAVKNKTPRQISKSSKHVGRVYDSNYKENPRSAREIPLDATPKHQVQELAKDEIEADLMRATRHRSSLRPKIPSRTSSIRVTRPSRRRNSSIDSVTDREVLRGLHVAAAAACDKGLDNLVFDKTGIRIRQLLADLMALESLGSWQPGEDLKSRSNERKAQMKRLKQQIRRSNEIRRVSGLRELRRQNVLAT